ncbi:MFS transporter [Sporolactobacillus inulinus]|uniref:Putative proline/betaine transporter n=1 Tax=Sporolactobacillus inulinus CASD TaxID=1069536 RepID=A0A0U1QLE5_9BACL|nr:MFS transporter [Sporolactobacillus inulinus]KLI01619.1 major facilitator transporter [Sporolactobacillus inulinus CASD]GEB77451.1 MFS transporter [Sporolactobacillus inulinus]
MNQPKLLPVVASSIIGATIEWYDFFLYGVVASMVLNHLYFPSDNLFLSTLLAYVTFAVGFFARPIGGIIFGHFGDKLGRKKMLVLTVMIMGISTCLIALLPTYAQIGIWAPIILLLLRVVQGIGLGGEWGGAVLMTYEYAPARKRGLYASLPQIGLALGLLLASGVVGILTSLLSQTQFLAWGWRVAFGLSVILVITGLWMRISVKETPEFQEVKENNLETTLPFKEMWKDGNSKKIIAGMGARYIDGVFFNVMGVFSIDYLTHHVKLSGSSATLSVSVAALVMCFFIPLFGHFSDRVGRIRIYLWGSLLVGLSAIPAFWLFGQSGGNMIVIILTLVVAFGILYPIVYGPEAALFSELFDPKVRYTGVSFVYQFSGIFASGITPIIATALLEAGGGSPLLLTLYVLFSGIVSALSVVWMKKLEATP